MTSKKPDPVKLPYLAVDISVQSDLWPDMAELIDRVVRLTLAESGIPNGASEVSVVLADDLFVHDLNKNWRGKDKPTNVLSFPQNDGEVLGDVILAHETITREAKAQDKSFEDHVSHLVMHGVLHLLGFDHENEADAEAMESLEIKVLSLLGIKNPYEDENFVP